MPTSFDPTQIRKILYIQYKPFGDVLCNTGVLPFIKARFPNAKLDYLAQHPCQQILYRNSNIDEIIVFKEGKGAGYLWNRLKICVEIFRRKYDLVIDQMCGTGSAQMTLFSGARYRLGYKDSRRKNAYNLLAERGETRYSASQKFDILAPLGITEQPYQMNYYIKPESTHTIEKWLQTEGIQDKRLICVAPGSKAAYKKWRVDCFAELCDWILAETDYKIILLWADYEWEDAETVARLMTYEPVMAPKTNLNEGAALLKHMTLLIGNDTALNHLSSVTHTPSLAFFGRTSPVSWSPTNDPHHYYLYHPGRYRDGDTTFGISVREAIDKTRDILTTLEKESS